MYSVHAAIKIIFPGYLLNGDEVLETRGHMQGCHAKGRRISQNPVGFLLSILTEPAVDFNYIHRICSTVYVFDLVFCQIRTVQYIILN